jgi:endonuclease/exonuclease/phosphatase family metal-dependent hydrolase
MQTMCIRAAISLLAALTLGVARAAVTHQGAPGAQVSSPVQAIPELSELLTYSPLSPCTVVPAAAAAPIRSRIVSWNIHAARTAPVDEIAAELRSMHADIAALQEVDVGVRRTGFIDEPGALAADLGFHYAFAASIRWDEGDYGLAVVSRWPLTHVRRYRLDTTAAGEPRIVLEVTVCASGRSLHVFNHHADGLAASRDEGLAALRGLIQAEVGHGTLVVGDFNERAEDLGVRGLIDAGLVDLGAGDNAVTLGRRRIDFLLADSLLIPHLSHARVWETTKSDHNAVLADLEW